MEVKTYVQKCHGYDERTGDYFWDRIHLVIDGNEVCIWESATSSFWLGLYENKNYKGVRFTNQKKFRDETIKFLKSEYEKIGKIYLDFQKLEEHREFRGNFWPDRMNNIL